MPKNIARTAKIQLNEQHLVFEKHLLGQKSLPIHNLLSEQSREGGGNWKTKKLTLLLLDKSFIWSWGLCRFHVEGFIQSQTWPHPISIIANYSPMTFFLFFFQLYYRGSCLLWSSRRWPESISRQNGGARDSGALETSQREKGSLLWPRWHANREYCFCLQGSEALTKIPKKSIAVY